MNDPTEDLRRELIKMISQRDEINRPIPERERLEKEYGQVWDTSEVQKDFSVESFLAPFILVTRKADKVKGTLMFTHSPRFYFNFEPK